ILDPRAASPCPEHHIWLAGDPSWFGHGREFPDVSIQEHSRKLCRVARHDRRNRIQEQPASMTVRWRGRPAGIFWKKDERLDALPFFYGVLKGLANVRATVNIAQYYWVQRTVWRTWPDQLSEADSIHAWIVGSADRIANWRKMTMTV